MFQAQYRPDNNLTLLDAVPAIAIIYNIIHKESPIKQITQAIAGSHKPMASIGGMFAYVAFRTNNVYDNMTYLGSSMIFNILAQNIKHTYVGAPHLKGLGLGSFALISLNHELNRSLPMIHPHDYILDIIGGTGLIALNRFKSLQFNHKYRVNAFISYLGLLTITTGITAAIFKYRNTVPSHRGLSYEYKYEGRSGRHGGSGSGGHGDSGSGGDAAQE
jgi:uncharacterized membrane protein YgcG